MLEEWANLEPKL